MLLAGSKSELRIGSRKCRVGRILTSSPFPRQELGPVSICPRAQGTCVVRDKQTSRSLRETEIIDGFRRAAAGTPRALAGFGGDSIQLSFDPNDWVGGVDVADRPTPFASSDSSVRVAVSPHPRSME